MTIATLLLGPVEEEEYSHTSFLLFQYLFFFVTSISIYSDQYRNSIFIPSFYLPAYWLEVQRFHGIPHYGRG